MESAFAVYSNINQKSPKDIKKSNLKENTKVKNKSTKTLNKKKSKNEKVCELKNVDSDYQLKIKEIERNIFKSKNLLLTPQSTNIYQEKNDKLNKIKQKKKKNKTKSPQTTTKPEMVKRKKNKIQQDENDNIEMMPIIHSTPFLNKNSIIHEVKNLEDDNTMNNKSPIQLENKSNKKNNKIKKIKDNVNLKKTSLVHSTPNSSKKLNQESRDISNISQSFLELQPSGNSIKEGEKLFQWIIHPYNIDNFLTKWEKEPVLIQRNKPEYYSKLISTSLLDEILRENNFQYGKNIDVTVYKDGKRETLNPIGRAHAPVVWDFYKKGNSIRLINPQTFIPRLAALNANLQEFFGCFVGANVYLTPPNSQGFAPHYDDIEAFVLQIEGIKQWKVYLPRNTDELLPRHSSGNFSDSDDLGEPFIDVALKPGQFLYFPRGFIHQAHSLPDVHSLHITLSCYQMNSWGDLLEKMIPVALSQSIESEPTLREGLPMNYLSYMGVVHSDKVDQRRQDFTNKIHNFIEIIKNYLPIDGAADQMGKHFIHSALPPVLSKSEKLKTVFEGGEKMTKNGKIENQDEITPNTKIKLIRAHVLRLVMEDNTIYIYYNVDNTLEYLEIEPQFFEIPTDIAPAVECLVNTYPNYISISDLPLENTEDKNWIAAELWERGLVMTE